MKQIKDILGLRPVSGDIGVEIEVEGTNILRGGDELWRTERDPSLKRGETVEYVLRKPLRLLQARKAVRELYKNNLRNGAGVNSTVRAGVHVHCNVQHLTATQLATVLTTYYLLEPTLVGMCGEGRKGNLFCLRLKDAEYPIMVLNEAYRDRRLGMLNSDSIRYASVNLKAIAQYGSLEFRALRTPTDYKPINRWIDIVSKVVNSYTLFDSPVEVMTAVSGEGAVGFASLVLGEGVVKGISPEQLSSDVREMTDIVQMFAFGHDWSEKKASPALNIFKTQVREDW